MHLPKLNYIFWNFLPSCFRLGIATRNIFFFLAMRSRWSCDEEKVKQQPYLLWLEGGWGRDKGCFCSSHMLSFICWLYWLPWGSRWACDFSTTPWIFLQHLKSLGQVWAYLHEGSTSFSCGTPRPSRLERERIDACSSLSSWASGHTCGFQLLFSLILHSSSPS